MSVLSIISDLCAMHALSVPTSVIGSTDVQTNQMLAILKEVRDDLVTQSKFNVTTQQAVFSTTPQMDQGALSVLAPYGYQTAIIDTFYDRTQTLPLVGPLNESEWEQIMALPSDGVWFKFRIWLDHLWLYPAPSATSPADIAFEYTSSWAIKSASGTLKAEITADDDVFVFPEPMMRKGLMYRWKQIKGLPYQADEKAYWDLVNNYIATDKVKRAINLANPNDIGVVPGIFLPVMNAVPTS
jgi:hypothetical protein